MKKGKNQIWIWVHHRDGAVEDITFGLVTEAQRLAQAMPDRPEIIAVAVVDAFESRPNDSSTSGWLEQLQYASGLDKINLISGTEPTQGHGEAVAGVLSSVIGDQPPCFFLMGHDGDSTDLAVRLAAAHQMEMVTRAVDLTVEDTGCVTAVRPIANGHLFETRHYQQVYSMAVTFLPAVLTVPDFETEPARNTPAPIDQTRIHEQAGLKSRIVDIKKEAPENLDITEADIIIAAGRGTVQNSNNNFGLVAIHALAKILGASVAGTRPVIDKGDLSFKRQIGQTGKTVCPRLIINCGISGANEYTAGMEKAHNIIAINTDPGARIFRFADLGLVGDLNVMLPLLVKALIPEDLNSNQQA